MKEIKINGAIGDVFNTAKDIEVQIASLGLSEGDDLKVIINSEGGSVFEGYAIYHLLKNLPYNVLTEGVGLVGSIATLIALAPPKENTSLQKVSMFMIHRAISPEGGNQEDLEKKQEILKEIDKVLIEVYSDRTGISPEEIEQMLSKETWMSGKEAVERGFVGKLVETESPIAVANSLYKLNSKEMALTDLFKKFKNEANEETVVNQNPVTGDEEKKEEAEAEAKAETDEEKEEEEMKGKEEEKEEAKAEVTMEMFNELVENVSKVAQAVDSVMNHSLTSETVNVAVESKFDALVNGLKKSDNQPAVGEVAKGGKVDPYARHREMMNKIESKTRFK